MNSSTVTVNSQRNYSPLVSLLHCLLLIELLMQTTFLLPFGIACPYTYTLCSNLLFSSIFMCFVLCQALLVKLLVTSASSLKFDLSHNAEAREFRFQGRGCTRQNKPSWQGKNSSLLQNACLLPHGRDSQVIDLCRWSFTNLKLLSLPYLLHRSRAVLAPRYNANNIHLFLQVDGNKGQIREVGL